MPRTIHRNSLLGATLTLVVLGLGTLGIVRSQSAPNFDPFREYFYQPKLAVANQILQRHDSLLSTILAERSALLWRDQSAHYTPTLLEMDYEGLYTRDSNFIQRRACWRSSLFARDVDFVEVSAYSVDGHVSLREMYAINQIDQRWAVVDSAGFPLFERCIPISAQDTSRNDDLRDFLLTLLSYAGYGSYNMLGKPDSVYHGIELAEVMEDNYYPFEISNRDDTTVVRFTSCLRGGVEVSRWGFLLSDDGVVIEESEQLVTFEDLPERVDSTKTGPGGRGDTTALGALLSDVPGDTGARTTPDSSANADSSANYPSAPGGVRLADLLSGKAKATSRQGNVSYEVLSFKPMVTSDSSAVLTGPEFVNFAQPQYPPLAFQQGQEDQVELMVRVDSSGKARQAMIVARPRNKGVGFDTNAKLAATVSDFRPGTVDGVKSDMWLTYRVTYRLRGNVSAGNEPVDSLALDTMALDTMEVDTMKTDTMKTDTAVTDTAAKDTARSDSVISVDTTNADTTLADTTATDTATLDTAKFDTSQADTAIIDSIPADSATSDSSK